MQDNEALKAKAEILMNFLESKKVIEDTKKYVKFCVSNSCLYNKAGTAIDDPDVKNMAIKNLHNIVESLSDIIYRQSNSLNEVVDALAELTGKISNENE